MSFLPRNVGQCAQVRAELVLALLRLGRFEDAADRALPLIGTPYQAWFLYTRAWLAWRQARAEEARTLLSSALALRGVRVPALLDFLTVEGLPLIAAEFSASPAPLPPTPARRTETPRLFGGPPRTPQQAAYLLRRLRPILAICASPFELVRATSMAELTDGDGWDTMVLESLASWPRLIAMGRGLHDLHRVYPSSLSVTACAAFYLNLAGLYQEALQVCQVYLERRPRSSLIRPLQVVALHGLGRRKEAVAVGEALMGEQEDADGLGCVVLGMLAFQEGRPVVALRFFQDAVGRSGHPLGTALAQQLLDLVP